MLINILNTQKKLSHKVPLNNHVDLVYFKKIKIRYFFQTYRVTIRIPMRFYANYTE